jgi:hypothetical protein
MAGLREEKDAWLTEEGGNLTLFKKSNPANGPTVTAVTHQINLERTDGSIIFDFTVSRTFFSKFIQHCFICRPSDSMCRGMPDWDLNPGPLQNLHEQSC